MGRDGLFTDARFNGLWAAAPSSTDWPAAAPSICLLILVNRPRPETPFSRATLTLLSLISNK
jgi:hypothetical protein